jgi:hypothetical protein
MKTFLGLLVDKFVQVELPADDWDDLKNVFEKTPFFTLIT